MTDTPPAHQTFDIEAFQDGRREPRSDFVTSEEPLEIQLIFGPDESRSELTIAVTMRTPGRDAELAIGFLHGEGIVRTAGEIRGAEHCGPPSPEKGFRNVIKVALEPDVVFDPSILDRNFYTNSSCGVCGKTSVDAVRVRIPEAATTASVFRVCETALTDLPGKLRNGQDEFLCTGGLHASATFTADGCIERIEEDVGRHNALDKLVGGLLIDDAPPLLGRGLMLSGRISFELVQKAAMAGCPFIAAVGSPSSLAVELAVEQGITLVGFLSPERFNIYSEPARVV